jgi:hypothetical protein
MMLFQFVGGPRDGEELDIDCRISEEIGGDWRAIGLDEIEINRLLAIRMEGYPMAGSHADGSVDPRIVRYASPAA